MDLEPTADSRRLRAIAEGIAVQFERYAPPRAVLLAGSAGAGTADEFSDIDLIAYYDQLPSDDVIQAIRKGIGVPEPGSAPARGGFGWGDEYAHPAGVHCGAGGFLVGYVDRALSELLVGREVNSAFSQRAALGLLRGLALRDDGLISGWKSRVSNFPDELAHAMAMHHLQIWPYWNVKEWIAARDARLFEVQALVDGAFHILGALSAANRLYFSSFNFKRMREHIAAMQEAPVALAQRLESLFELDGSQAAVELQRLVKETLEIVELKIPTMDTTEVRRTLLGGGQA